SVRNNASWSLKKRWVERKPERESREDWEKIECWISLNSRTEALSVCFVACTGGNPDSALQVAPHPDDHQRGKRQDGLTALAPIFTRKDKMEEEGGGEEEEEEGGEDGGKRGEEEEQEEEEEEEEQEEEEEEEEQEEE
ncbi:hypothetical protein Pcinc_040652, partial [Petrolisthes cinctipes]